jgi:hypothetical protein
MFNKNGEKMRIAFVHPKVTGDENHYYWSGWRTAFGKYDVEEFECGQETLAAIDGRFDLCMVCPGFINYPRDFYKPKTHTRYIIITEEDMHCVVESFRVLADYYHHIFLFSEFNAMILNYYGINNVSQILPCVDPRFFSYHEETNHQNHVVFFGQSDNEVKIQGFTRAEYFQLIEEYRNELHPFTGRGFYNADANMIYNDSRFGLDLPTTSVIGPRCFQVGSTSATVLLPKSNVRSRMWKDNFALGYEYLEFENGFIGLLSLVKSWADKEDERLKIAKNMSTKMLQKHTFEKRFEEILTKIF